MGGLFGILDPSGADQSLLARAAESASYRGSQRIIASGPFAAGLYVPDGGSGPLERAGSVLAADARVDGSLPGSPAAKLEGSFRGVELLDEVLRASGPPGLMGLAADFALARFDLQRRVLTLARDAFGVRPLYWAKVGRRFAFASDASVLQHLGLASADLDPAVVAGYLARFGVPRGRTGFKDVFCVPPGSWLSVDLNGRTWEGRWFDPGQLAGPRLSTDEAVEATREAVLAALRSRAVGDVVGVSLSGGRDSGAIALALAEIGVTATCITQEFDQDLNVDETGPARSLAERAGHHWMPSFVPSNPSQADLERLPVETGGPLGSFAFPQSHFPAAGAGSAGIQVLLTGEGGEPLFSPAPVAVLDLLRRGRMRDAAAAARTFDREWTYSYLVIAKAIARALVPRSFISFREGFRPVAPWLNGRVVRPKEVSTAPRNADEHLMESLLMDEATGFELEERIHARYGVVIAYPLMDLRVVRVALQLSVEDRAPVREPKPVLARAFLGDLARSRVKMIFTPYYERLSGAIFRDHRPLVSPRTSLAARSGILDPKGLGRAMEDRWRLEALPLVPLEMWLRTNV
jgi:asparagine synthetase B (glutamine-hydrolysing)